MKTLRVALMGVFLAIGCSGTALALSVDDALGRLSTYKLGEDNEVVTTIREAAVGSFQDAAARNKLATGLAALLQSSEATIDAKQFACRELALIGTGEQVPALVKLLGNEELSQMARYALARLPGVAVDHALIDALSRTRDANRLGIINTLGHRRTAAAVEPLTRLLSAGPREVTAEAAKALGRMGTPVAADALEKALQARSGVEHDAVADAYLECAGLSRAGGDAKKASLMYTRVLDSDLPSYIRGAALKGFVATMPAEVAAGRVLSALRGGDKQLQTAGAQVAAEMNGPDVSRALAAALPNLPPRTQRMLIYALAKRGDHAALSAVTNASGSADAGVRMAVLEALGVLGDATSVPVLLHAATQGTDAERAAAQRSLAALRAEDVNGALFSRLNAASDKERAEIIAALASRNATDSVLALLKMAQGDSRQVRLASIEGLQGLAGAEDIPALVDLLANAAPEDRNQVRKMLVAVAHRCKAEKQTSDGLVAKQQAAGDPDVRGTLLLTLGDLADEAALPVLRKALDDGEEAVRRAATTALSGWPTAEPLADLLRIARAGRDDTGKVLALRGYIDLVGRADTMKPQEKVQSYKTALSLASSAAEKKRVFTGLATIRTLEAMQLAASSVPEQEVKEEAALATVTIAKDLYAGNAEPVRTALERVVAAGIREATKEQAQQMLDEIGATRTYLKEWEVAGPYMEDGKNYSQLFDTAFGPEVPTAQVEWRKMAVSTNGPHPAYCDLLEELNGGEQRVAYLRTQIESAEPKAVMLEIFSDDGVKVWLNGKIIHAHNVARAIGAEPDRVTVTLEKGANRLMLKVTQNNQGWGAVVRVREAKAAASQSAAPKIGERFKLHVINADSRFEAAGVLDVNRDGKLDIFCGGYWYEAPDWKPHFVRDIKEEGNYFYDFANLPMDVDGDGWVDIVDAAWHNKMVFWVKNPGPRGGPWEVFPIDTPGNIETAIAADINGDGQPDILPNIMSEVAWYEFHRDSSAPGGARWEKHQLPKVAAGHGIGAGDINKDGRCDIVAPKGWLEQTATGWDWHPEFDLGQTSIPILVHDVDGDGLPDIIWGLGHDYGIYWLQQKNVNGQRTWEKHLIDKSWSQPHFMVMADIDNDGEKELITGKRYYAHNGHDPGEDDGECIYYYKFDKTTQQWTRHVVSEGGRVGFGINTVVVDIDGDGDLDIVAPGKSGLYLLENLTKNRK